MDDLLPDHGVGFFVALHLIILCQFAFVTRCVTIWSDPDAGLLRATLTSMESCAVLSAILIMRY